MFIISISHKNDVCYSRSNTKKAKRKIWDGTIFILKSYPRQNYLPGFKSRHFSWKPVFSLSPANNDWKDWLWSGNQNISRHLSSISRLWVKHGFHITNHLLYSRLSGSSECVHRGSSERVHRGSPRIARISPTTAQADIDKCEDWLTWRPIFSQKSQTPSSSVSRIWGTLMDPGTNTWNIKSRLLTRRIDPGVFERVFHFLALLRSPIS